MFIEPPVGCREVLHLLMFFLLNGFKVGLCIMAQPYHILVLLAMVNIQHVRLFICPGSLKLAFELGLGHFLVFLQLKKVTFHHLLQFLSSQRNIRSILVLYDTL